MTDALPLIETGKPLESDALAGLLALASRTVAVMVGKPERYVMVMKDHGAPLFFAGSDAPAI